MGRVRLAVIGAGRMGAKHAAMIHGHETCTLAGIADPDPDRERVASELEVPFYQTPDELLERTHAHGAVIATPNSAHVAAAMVCAERGIHMLVEKPIADTLQGAQAIAAVAQDHHVSVLTGHHRRHNPLVQRTRELVRGGCLGSVVGFSALWTLLKPDDYFTDSWRRQRPGGGPLLINLIHDLDNLRYICGEVASVYARTSSGVRGFAVEDSLSLCLTLESGALGTVFASDATPAPWSYEATTRENPAFHNVPENCYYFAGTRASLAFPRMELWHYPDGPARGWTEPLQCRCLASDAVDPLVAQLEHFCRVVRGAEEPLVSAEDAGRSLAVALAAQASAETGVPVNPVALWEDAREHN